MVTESRPPKTSKELQNALYDDFKRQAIDAAKKRAVAQNVDYETFRNMVHVAHLCPLQAPNKGRPEAAAPSWSFAADGSRVDVSAADAEAASTALLSRHIPTTPPSTSNDFMREWRRSCPRPDDKFAYLALAGPAVLGSIFKVEISCEVLRDILSVLDACWLGHAGAAEEGSAGGAIAQAGWVLSVLQALGRAGRFSLAVKLLGSSGKAVVDSLFGQLRTALAAADAAAAAGEDDAAAEVAGSGAVGMLGGQLQELAAAYGATLPTDS